MAETPKFLVQPLQAPVLKLARDDAAFALHKAALEWDLQEPIVIETEEDIKSRPGWRDVLEPYFHQVRNLITFCRRLPVTLLADDVGLGKTISAGLVLSELISRNRVSKVLVICPRLLMPQWQEELKTKFHIDSIYESGQRLRRVLKRLKDGENGALITTYASARLYFDHLEKVGFQMLILDEAHKLRNLHGTDSPPQVAVRIRKSLADRTFKYVLMLTATPIQNRLWDVYSLVDLLSVARGHQNPFGTEDTFARRFIADSAVTARQLRPDRKEEFRSIVYNYMSRVRRGDAKLVFPERKVKLYRVLPTPAELKLFQLIASPIQNLNGLAQISIAKALVSSPQALSAQLKNMAEKGTIPRSLYEAVAEVTKGIGITAKLKGLDSLIAQLRTERPADWRLIVFTERLETQRTIGEYLDRLGVSCGFISGASAKRNQETIQRFKKDPPEINVIVSTEAGSEGVNLQVANVMMNYDLPWNPMIVEQRVGRIQRLGSAHKNVAIFNAILQGTFEEHIVGRLMEKLQLAAHAIGDIESLLEAAGLEDDGEESKFEEILRRLVIASLAGKDVEQETKLRLESITEAKKEIEREEQAINSMLGVMDDPLRKGPRAPRLSEPKRSMDVRAFVLNAFALAGLPLREERPGVFMQDRGGERIIFDEVAVQQYIDSPVLYRPGSQVFDRLIGQHLSANECMIEGLDSGQNADLNEPCKKWVEAFGGTCEHVREKGASDRFSGVALLRLRASVAHDGYEKLVEVSCEPSAATPRAIQRGTLDIAPTSLGIDLDKLVASAVQDADIAEFCRFYIERRTEETKGAGDDERKRAKLIDDFTPRIHPSLVGLNGSVSRTVHFEVTYRFQEHGPYVSSLAVDSRTLHIIASPALETCELTGARAPLDCMQRCAVSNRRVLKHLLVKSAISEKSALPENMVVCSLTGKQVLSTEVEVSAVTGKAIIAVEMKTSAVSGKRAETAFFATCDFSKSEVLQAELATSQISGKRYRVDEEAESAVSGKRGHRAEFIRCSETGKWLLSSEAEHCEVTGVAVTPGVLEKCEATSKRVVPKSLGECAITGKKVLVDLLVVGSISKVTMLKNEGIRSSRGRYCLPNEAIVCSWDGKLHHPDDMAWCSLTGAAICREYLAGTPPCLGILKELLNRSAVRLETTGREEVILATLSGLIGKGSYRIASSALSPGGHSMAIVVESRSWFGLKTRQLGLIYNVNDNLIAGKVVAGRWDKGAWAQEVS